MRFRKKEGVMDDQWKSGWLWLRPLRGVESGRSGIAKPWGPQATELIRLVKDGNDAGVTPDGSKGPKYQAKSGALFIAGQSFARCSVVLFI